MAQSADLDGNHVNTGDESTLQKYDLHWNYHDTIILNGICNFLDSGSLTDIILSVENQTIKAHKLVLASCSPYFLQLFKEMESVQHPVIVLQDVAYDDISAIIAYMYQGKCIVTSDRLKHVLSVAKMLKIRGLCDLSCPPQHEQEHCPPVPELLPTTPLASTSLSQFNNRLPDVVNVESEKIFVPKTNESEIEDDDQQKVLKKLKQGESTCLICGKQLSNQYNLRVHLETHQAGYYACQSCPHISRSRDALRKHVSYRHSPNGPTTKKKLQHR